MKDYVENILRFWKSIWGKLITFILCGSIIALFIASFCLDKELTLSVMNEWVSLIVGMAALILGIISLFLSFYNVEQSNDMQKDTIKIMTDVKEDITKKLNEIQINMEHNFSDIKMNSNFQGNGDSGEMKMKVDRDMEWREVDE